MTHAALEIALYIGLLGALGKAGNYLLDRRENRR